VDETTQVLAESHRNLDQPPPLAPDRLLHHLNPARGQEAIIGAMERMAGRRTEE
jgi:hypothetical protein